MNILDIRDRHFPLHEAVAGGFFDIVQSLLDEGYCVNELHYDRVTPLHMACLKGNLRIVYYLLNKGAWWYDVQSKTLALGTLFKVSSNYPFIQISPNKKVNCQSIDNSTPLCDACAGGNTECVKLLLEAGAWVNPPLLLSTPLHEASLRGYSAIVALLLTAGAEINRSDLHYGTPLHAACSMRHPNLESIKLLVKAGARVNAIKIHKTPLHLIAANSQSIEAAKLLIFYGANVYLKDGNGKTPRDLCTPNSELATFLSMFESEPKSLAFCCRLTILNHLGTTTVKYLSKLPIPSLILGYLE